MTNWPAGARTVGSRVRAWAPELLIFGLLCVSLELMTAQLVVEHVLAFGWDSRGLPDEISRWHQRAGDSLWIWLVGLVAIAGKSPWRSLLVASQLALSLVALAFMASSHDSVASMLLSVVPVLLQALALSISMRTPGSALLHPPADVPHEPPVAPSR
jgi:hypothetical protein